MTNIETIRAALLGIVSKTEREEALKALDGVERVIELAEELINQGNFTYLGGEYVFCAKPDKAKELEEKINGLIG